MGEPGRALTERHCSPHAKLLRGDQLADLRRLLPDWKVADDKQIVKTFVFPDFVKALAFVNRAGEVAEAEGHHPDLYLAWGRVDAKISSHDAGGLTENDFILAAKIDRAYFAG